MNFNLLSNNNLFDYGILIGCGLILGCSVFYLIRSNYTANLPTNTEALTKQEIEAIVNENAVTIINNENIDAIIDSDSDTDVESQSTSDYDSILDVNTTDLDLFFMPDVDFDVCSIHELKLFEISSIFHKEIAEKSITEEELIDLIHSFTDADLATNSINELILLIITHILNKLYIILKILPLFKSILY
nr:hypothetical protein [Lactarius zonarius]